MAGSPIGNLWLKEKFGLQHELTHQSHLGRRLRLEADKDGNIVETYSPQYDVGDSVLAHIEFGLTTSWIPGNFAPSLEIHRLFGKRWNQTPKT